MGTFQQGFTDYCQAMNATNKTARMEGLTRRIDEIEGRTGFEYREIYCAITGQEGAISLHCMALPGDRILASDLTIHAPDFDPTDWTMKMRQPCVYLNYDHYCTEFLSAIIAQQILEGYEDARLKTTPQEAAEGIWTVLESRYLIEFANQLQDSKKEGIYVRANFAGNFSK